MTSRGRSRCGDMSLSSRTLLTTAALAAAVIAPSAANAAEGFTAVTSTGDVVQLHSDTAPGLTGIHKVTGLAAGESIVGLDRAPTGELLGLTSAGNIASVDRDTGKATREVPGARHDRRRGQRRRSPSPSRPTARARASSPPGRDVVINLANGAATDGPGLTFAAGDPHAGAQAAPALDYAADGRLIGVAAGQGAYAVQTAAGAATLQTLVGDALPEPPSPTRSTVASDGSVWTAANLSDKPNRPAAVAPRALRPGHGHQSATRAPSSASASTRSPLTARWPTTRRRPTRPCPARSCTARSSAASTPTGPACASRPTRAARPSPRCA